LYCLVSRPVEYDNLMILVLVHLYYPADF
jgi:hypothetical protein